MKIINLKVVQIVKAYCTVIYLIYRLRYDKLCYVYGYFANGKRVEEKRTGCKAMPSGTILMDNNVFLQNDNLSYCWDVSKHCN